MGEAIGGFSHLAESGNSSGCSHQAELGEIDQSLAGAFFFPPESYRGARKLLGRYGLVFLTKES